MDEIIQIALFVLFALFSLGSNLLNKRKKQQAEKRRNVEETEADVIRPPRGREVSSPNPPEVREEQPMSFEDILRELTGESPRSRREEREEIEDDYEHPFSPAKPERQAEKKIQEQAQEKAAQKSDTFGKSVEQARQAKRISDKIIIDDEPLTEKLEVKTEKSKKSLRSKRFARSIGASLKKGKNARKAIILSEIINRKYF